MAGFEAGSLPDSQKEALCRSLLSEFGVTRVRERDDELIHGCLVPWSSHSDQDRNPTASLNWSKLTYKCLGCGAGGGLLWFIQTVRHCDHKEARGWLGKATGLDGNVMDLHDLLNYFDALYENRGSRVPPIPTYDDRILAPWMMLHPWLFDPEPEGRGIPEEALLKFKVGYAPDYPVNDNKVSERIVVPHYWQGQLVGWQTRRLADDGTPKYLSSPDFPKDTTLLNYDPKQRVAIVVESSMSVLKHHLAIPNFVSTFGASVTDRQVKLLCKYERVILWMDNDDAGWNATEGTWETSPRGKTTKVAEGLGDRLAPFVPVEVVESPYAGDPANLPTSVALELVENAVPYSVWHRPTQLRVFEEVSA